MEIRKVQSLTEINEDIRNFKINHKGSTVLTLFLKKKLFVADYSFLDSIPLHRDFVFYSPQVLLNLNERGSMEIIAIHLRTKKRPQSYVITKSSPPNKFLFAKMHVALADAQSHEFVHHLPIHLMMESVAIARHNYLGELLDTNYSFINKLFDRKPPDWKASQAFHEGNNFCQFLCTAHADKPI